MELKVACQLFEYHASHTKSSASEKFPPGETFASFLSYEMNNEKDGFILAQYLSKYCNSTCIFFVLSTPLLMMNAIYDVITVI